MSESKGSLRKYLRFLLLAVIAAAAVYLASSNFYKFWYILMAVVGFGTMVIVHELGHFIVAKLSGIKVEAFSIFMPPTFISVRKTEDGLRFRILPKFFPKENDESGDGLGSFAVGEAGKACETEYRIGLVPFGGFVKMLGQDDIGPNKTSDDPRSYANKPVGTRAAVIAAGVVFNIISAIAAFVMVFLIGIYLIPPVAGSVWPDSPAARAGLRSGDEIIEIAGKSDNLDFMDIQMTAALSDVNEAISLKVRHIDGSVEDFAIAAKKLPGQKMRVFGIALPQTLTIAKVSDPNALLGQTGFLPGDRIKTVNGKEVKTHWELEKIIETAFAPAVTVLAERTDKSGKCRLIESEIKLTLDLERTTDKTKLDLGHIYSMVPRLKITGVLSKPDTDDVNCLDNGDIIIAAGGIENPTYKELRKVTEEHKDKELTVKVLRQAPDGTEKTITTTVVPRWSKDANNVMIGVGIALDLEHAVVADTIAAEDGSAGLAIPRGAEITAVDGVTVSNFYDIAREIGRSTSERISIEYRLDEQIAGDVVLNVGRPGDLDTVKTTFAELVPFKLFQRLYKADGPIGAVVMGYNKTIMSIVWAYVTLQRFVGGGVSAKSFRGPVGLIDISYRILTQEPLIYYVYILGLISVFIAVFNLLPILPFDGGHIVFLLVEKIKGSPVSERIQAVVLYTGLTLVGALALYVTFNDIVRSFFS